jgi:hypothetical protein
MYFTPSGTKCNCTGLFISPSGVSELDCATTKTETAERSISIGRESLQNFFCTRVLGVLAGSTARGVVVTKNDVNVFCAVSSCKVYRPFFFAEPTVNGINYLDML